jgi:hypothetical protein
MSDSTTTEQTGAAPEAQGSAPSTQAPASAATAVDTQALISAALNEQAQKHAAELKAATGFDSVKALKEKQLAEEGKFKELLDAKAQEADSYKTRYEQTQISNALLTASTDAVDPAIVAELLRAKAVVAEDGSVSIDGKPAAEAVKALLTEKPFLAKAQGGTGSGAPQGAGNPATNKAAELEAAKKAGDISAVLRIQREMQAAN